MIYKSIRDLLGLYSFVTKVELKNAYVYIYYGEDKWKRISIRANRDRLITLIESIKEEIGFYEDLEKRKKEGQYDIDENAPLIFSNR